MPRALVAPVLVALALTLGYALYFAPVWGVRYDDHLEYAALAKGLVERAEYTRAPVGAAFVPESLRWPGYPLALAAICKTVGCDGWRVAALQAALYALMIPLVWYLAHRIDPRVAMPTAWLTALYLPFARYAARPLSDFLATVLLVTATCTFFLARDRRSIAWGMAFGAICAWLGLTRPAFLLVPLAFALGGWLVDRRALLSARRSWIFAALAFLVLVAPVLIQSAAYFGAPSSGSSGSNLWLGYFQGRQAEPQAVARFDGAALANARPEEIVALGTDLGLDALESTLAAEAKRRLAAFDGISDRLTQAYAFVELDGDLRTLALQLIAHDPLGWSIRGLTIRSVELWAGDDPFNVPGFDPPLPWSVGSVATRLVLAIFAVVGIVAGLRGGRRELYLYAALLAYVSLASFPFWTEGRFSLPVTPLLLIAAVIGLRSLLKGRSSEPQHTLPGST